VPFREDDVGGHGSDPPDPRVPAAPTAPLTGVHYSGSQGHDRTARLGPELGDRAGWYVARSRLR
jgi:hypothetical protein